MCAKCLYLWGLNCYRDTQLPILNYSKGLLHYRRSNDHYICRTECTKISSRGDLWCSIYVSHNVRSVWICGAGKESWQRFIQQNLNTKIIRQKRCIVWLIEHIILFNWILIRGSKEIRELRQANAKDLKHLRDKAIGKIYYWHLNGYLFSWLQLFFDSFFPQERTPREVFQPSSTWRKCRTDRMTTNVLFLFLACSCAFKCLTPLWYITLSLEKLSS